MSTLFDPPPTFDRGALSTVLRGLAAGGVWVGTSSWKYEGWLGQIYSRDRYLTRGRFSQRLFEASCLREYAETFPSVCGDFSFYQFPSEAYWQRLFHSSPDDLVYSFKVPEDITVRVFPSHPKYGQRGGQPNPSFLDAALFENAFLRALEPYRSQVGVLIFEFGTFSRAACPDAGDFVAELDRFLASIPRTFRYSVEIRNPEYLKPRYFDCLRSHGVAHVFNAWTRMPDIGQQTGIPGAFTAGFTVCRVLLSRGRTYEEAVKKFSPYEKVQEPNPEARESLRSLIRRAREQRQEAFVYVNNRLEGNAPETIRALVE